jgi:hypothetical protein
MNRLRLAMHVMRLVLVLAAVAAPALLTPLPARANVEYPWCAVYSGDAGGASNCGFTTWQQCMATVSGIGGSCEPNQFYNPRAQAPPKRKRRTR